MNEAQTRIVEGLRRAMQAESEGHHFYMMAAQSTQDARGRQTFEEFAQEERVHFEFLQGQLKSVLATGQVDRGLELGSAKEFTGEHPIFSEEILTRVKSAHYEMTALSIGIQLEMSSVQFYHAEAAAVDDAEVKAFYEELAAWEQGHLAVLQRQADTLKEDYWNDAHFSPF